ncbi:replication-relaxation family protein [Couchioplanes caeruleus]|uniref:replication-relaxation family protein n=1 Tax=Couchioplanes caeruleus TaxID=56438 RepID=UPI0020BDFD18|nr:replication-relaxation family protein [Couchioplanes caeruleus]UQU64789.1 replication-relaxation family protein [Couchioplanes caeruleus]
MASSLLRVQSQLTTRDLVLLGWLADHRLLTTFQIATALFPSLDYAQERLRTLYRLAVIDRFRPQRPDGGSYPYHYVLAQLGDDVVAAQRGDDLPRRDRARRRREHLTSRANLPHLLGVNTFFTDLAGHARTHPHADLVRWWSAARCQQMGAFADDGDDIHVRTYTPTSRPDGHGIYTEHGHRVAFFLEYDTGTERPLSRLVDKLDGYHAQADNTGRVWPVLFWLPSTEREAHLHHALARDGTRYPVATAARDQPGHHNPAGAIWWIHGLPGRRLHLAELSPDTP